MIQANELRIGNLTYRIDLTNKNKSVIDKLTVSDIERIEHGKSKIYKYEPIQIDNELLEKFGFNKCFETCFELNGFILNENFILMDIDITIKLDYVHELQNLYFALTKNELKLKL
jgi:hypothetical protein